jgi:hypothetical protein
VLRRGKSNYIFLETLPYLLFQQVLKQLGPEQKGKFRRFPVTSLVVKIRWARGKKRRKNLIREKIALKMLYM